LCAGAFIIAAMPFWWFFIPGMIIFGMGYYTMHGTLQTRATELNPQARATAVSLFAFIFFLGQGIGPVLMGQGIQSLGYGGAYSVAGVVALLLALWSSRQFARLAVQRAA
jgi:predicted MFS family arabinose efflux permease